MAINPLRRMSCLMGSCLVASMFFFASFVAVLLHPAAAQDAFYEALAQDIVGPAGSIIRQEPMQGAPDGASAYRVLYRSTNPQNEPIAVSGIIIVPAGAVPEQGRPIVAWAHPTTGIVPHCAPSLAMFVFQQIAGLREAVARGYVVSATDYPGLGTPGPHPYLVGESEARSVIDSVRAARALPNSGAADVYAAWGHSQGGHAALFTGLIAASYAPELHLVGVAVAAPATELATLMTDDLNTSGGRNLTAMTMWSWARVFKAPIDSVIAPAAMPTVDRLATECIESLFDILERNETSKPLAQSFLSVQNPALTEPWRSLLLANSPGMLPASLPVFIAQGAKDQLVRPAVTRDYAERLCRSGVRVRSHLMPNVNHGTAGTSAASAAMEWMEERFAHHPAPSDCASLR